MRAVPVYAEYPGGKYLLGHRVIEGNSAGALVFPGEYVVAENKPKALIDDAALINKTVNLIVAWESSGCTKSATEDRRDFATDLVQFFKAHLCG
ncbi:hypothetical protein ACE106_07260 [Shouchella clausii]|uniref:hypothetical protein n=1 Tax=Shouchella clausii TaxID=79880 RepID=UPI0028A1B5F0|nr:hypothetical protein [Shouchella clausii]